MDSILYKSLLLPLANIVYWKSHKSTKYVYIWIGLCENEQTGTSIVRRPNQIWILAKQLSESSPPSLLHAQRHLSTYAGVVSSLMAISGVLLFRRSVPQYLFSSGEDLRETLCDRPLVSGALRLPVLAPWQCGLFSLDGRKGRAYVISYQELWVVFLFRSPPFAWMGSDATFMVPCLGISVQKTAIRPEQVVPTRIHRILL